jgi:TnpA family transposase
LPSGSSTCAREAAEDPIALMTAVLADATNPGLASMAQSSGVFSHTHVSDRFAPFYTKVIAGNASEAAHVLDRTAPP